MIAMEQSAIEFEAVAKGTLQRWRTTAGQEKNAEDNVKWAIAYALDRDYYQGFTNRNGERQKALDIGKEGIEYALFSNMLQLSGYKRQRMGESLGTADSFILLVTESCVNGEFNDLQELLHSGVREMVNEQLAKRGQNTTVSQGKARSSSDEVAYQFANSVLDCYVWFNTSYGTVSAANPIPTAYDEQAKERLDIHYRTMRVTRQNQEKNQQNL